MRKISNQDLISIFQDVWDNQSDQIASLQFADDETELTDLQYTYLQIVRARLREVQNSIVVIQNTLMKG